jgi:hypothetical protein
MKCFYRKVETEYGEHEFVAEALQPAGCPLLIEFSTDCVNWEAIGQWGAYFEDQQVSAGVVTRHDCGFLRATPLPAESPSPLGGERAGVRGESVKPGQWKRLAPESFKGQILIEPPLTLTQLKAELAKRGTPPPPALPQSAISNQQSTISNR